MATLPTEVAITAAEVPNAIQKTNFAAIRNFIADLLGTDSSNKAAARAALGARADLDAYGKENILGTVSQSSGVPTGAIIESGSNANGEYVMYADGTQICTHSVSLGNTAVVTTFGVLTHAAAFISVPSTICTLRSGVSGAPFGYYVSVPTTTTHTLMISNSGTYTNGYFIAVGRWF